MKLLVAISASFLLASATNSYGKSIKVPKEINGQAVKYVMWSKTHASGSISRRMVRARFSRPMKIPFPFGNSKTCFLNSKRESITCRK